MFENLGKALGLLRELRGLTQAQTAKAAGTGKSQLSKYERSKELPKLESLEKILKVLGVGSFEFFCTLRLVDDRAASMDSGQPIPTLPNLQGAYSSILNPATQASFQTVFADFLNLHAHMVERVVLGRLDEMTPLPSDLFRLERGEPVVLGGLFGSSTLKLTRGRPAMSSYLLTNATSAELKALLLAAGKEILAEGGLVEVTAFLSSERSKSLDPAALIWLPCSQQEMAEIMSDEE